MKTLAFLAWTALCPLTLLGCATLPKTAIVDGQEVPRKTLEFTGSPYSITHRAAHPRPGGPSSGLRDAGGNITGMVCGMDVDYSVRHEGDQVVMVGFLDQTQPTQLSVRDQRGVRVVSGNLAGLAVNLQLTSNALVGQVGLRAFRLEQDGANLKGPMVTTGTDPTTATLNNRDQLWAMPAAEDAGRVGGRAMRLCPLPGVRAPCGRAPVLAAKFRNLVRFALDLELLGQVQQERFLRHHDRRLFALFSLRHDRSIAACCQTRNRRGLEERRQLCRHRLTGAAVFLLPADQSLDQLISRPTLISVRLLHVLDAHGL